MDRCSLYVERKIITVRIRIILSRLKNIRDRFGAISSASSRTSLEIEKKNCLLRFPATFETDKNTKELNKKKQNNMYVGGGLAGLETGIFQNSTGGPMARLEKLTKKTY